MLVTKKIFNSDNNYEFLVPSVKIDNANDNTRENLILLIEQICKPNLKLTIKNSLSLNFQINFIPEYKLLLEPFKDENAVSS